jgi:hypothetical protein
MAREKIAAMYIYRDQDRRAGYARIELWRSARTCGGDGSGNRRPAKAPFMHTHANVNAVTTPTTQTWPGRGEVGLGGRGRRNWGFWVKSQGTMDQGEHAIEGGF